MDRYSLTARIYPIILFILPIIVIALVFSLHFESYVQIGVSVGVTGALAFLFSQLGRDGGKRKEKKLWQVWGGTPSTQLLRWSNTEIDIITKRRYHDALNRACPVDHTPDSQMEQEDSIMADSIYLSWSKFLINRSRDTSKFALLFRENINYGFRRNLWGMKTHAIVLIILLMMGIASYHFFIHPDLDFPITFYISEGLLLLFLLFWLIQVRRDWVAVPAYAYAHRLMETIDDLQ